MVLNVLAFQNVSPRKITVYVMKGCGACESYKPLVIKVAQEMERLGYCLPVIELVDVEQKEREAEMNGFGVRYTPTTVYQRGDGYWRKWEQALAERDLRGLLERVSRGACTVE